MNVKQIWHHFESKNRGAGRAKIEEPDEQKPAFELGDRGRAILESGAMRGAPFGGSGPPLGVSFSHLRRKWLATHLFVFLLNIEAGARLGGELAMPMY